MHLYTIIVRVSTSDVVAILAGVLAIGTGTFLIGAWVGQSLERFAQHRRRALS